MESTVANPTLALPHQSRRQTVQTRLVLLFLGDILVVAFALLVAYFVRFSLLKGVGWASSLAYLESYQVHLVLGTGAMAVILYFKGAYHIETVSRFRYGALRMINCAFLWGVLFVSLSLFFKVDPSISRAWTGLSVGLIGVGLSLWRYLYCKHLAASGALQSARRKTLVLGWNEAAAELQQKSEDCSQRGNFFPFDVRGMVVLKDCDDASVKTSRIFRGVGDTSLESELHSGRYDTLVVANTALSQADLLRVQELCGREMVDFMVIPDFIHTLTSCLRIESYAGMPMLTQHQREVNKTSSLLIKRSFDIAGALFGLMAFSPVIAYFAWRVHRESPGPVFYKQTRLGEHGRHFEMIKIRSMRVDAEKETGPKWCTEEDPRRLKVGAFMRKYNIDELPQFWNVLKGDMSLVGPRPERPELIQDFKHEISFYNVRHAVKPGITGWAQVNGWRGDTCLQARIACDLEYIERWSPWFDLYICLRTLWSNKNAY